MQERLRTDPEAVAMIEDYRNRFSSAPIGVWIDCIDDFVGIGFGGVSGKFSHTEVHQDGTGSSADEDETIKFEWRRVRERVIEVRCIDRIPAPDNWTAEEIAEDRQWQQVEYDFVVPELVNVPTITDVYRTDDANFPIGTALYRCQFLECFNYRFGGLLRFGGVTPKNPVAAVSKEPGWSMTRMITVLTILIATCGWVFLASEYAKRVEGWEPVGKQIIRGRISLLIASVVGAASMVIKGIMEIPNAVAVVQFSLANRIETVNALAVILILIIAGGFGAKALEKRLESPYKKPQSVAADSRAADAGGDS